MLTEKLLSERGKVMKIRTIKGPVPPEKLGATYTHEHLICYPPANAMKEDYDFELPQEEKAIKELEYFQESGGGCLVEGTAIDYGRDVEALGRIATAVDVHIVFTTGFNKGRFHPDWAVKMDADALADLMSREVIEGVGGTGFKAGIIKGGSWYNVILPKEEKVIRAVARAHKKTGAPIWMHTEAGTMGLEQLDLLEEEGVDLNRVCLGHIDRNPDPWYHKKIAARGAYLGYDCPGKIKYGPDSVRVNLIKEILDAGYEKQLLISGDMGRRSYLTSYGGGPGFEFLLKKFIPRLLDEGLEEREIEQIWVKNPATYLSF